ncbi:Uncharacterised protein [Aeromonas salmonicida]|nr:Uncharacterised protein [Aeromonas salmonicida]SUU70516.1 Uncharacterised protein [Aeromonas salmonicida]
MSFIFFVKISYVFKYDISKIRYILVKEHNANFSI